MAGETLPAIVVIFGTWSPDVVLPGVSGLTANTVEGVEGVIASKVVGLCD